MNACLVNEIKFCEKTWPFHSLMEHQKIVFEICISFAYAKCWAIHHGEEKMTSQHLLCVRNCIKN